MTMESQENGGIIQPAINVKIILSEDTSPVKSSQGPTVRHCGDEIRGHLQVVTYGNFEFEIKVAFEGVIRTWIGWETYTNPSTAEFQFLQETQTVYSDPSTRSYEGNLCTDRLPFQFLVPHELISARSDTHSDFLKLCPSTKQGLKLCDLATRKMFLQPMITYMVRIKRIRTTKVVEDFMRSIYQREITIMPYTSAAPPLLLEAFPQEYKTCVTKSVKQHSWRRSFGILTLSAAEPSPINILAFEPRPSTSAALKLVLIPNYPGDLDQEVGGWDYVVKHYLRIRTFYSTKKLEQMPTLTATRKNPFLRIHDQKGPSEVREYPKLIWNKDEESHWMVNFKVPIRTTKTVLPTFLNQLSARQYAVVLRLSIRGVSHGVLELVLPLQVIFSPPLGLGLGQIGGETPGSQEEIMSSVTLLSQDSMSLEVDEAPPSYEL